MKRVWISDETIIQEKLCGLGMFGYLLTQDFDCQFSRIYETVFGCGDSPTYDKLAIDLQPRLSEFLDPSAQLTTGWAIGRSDM